MTEFDSEGGRSGLCPDLLFLPNAILWGNVAGVPQPDGSLDWHGNGIYTGKYTRLRRNGSRKSLPDYRPVKVSEDGSLAVIALDGGKSLRLRFCGAPLMAVSMPEALWEHLRGQLSRAGMGDGSIERIAKHPAGRWKVDDDFGMPTDAEERP